MDFKEQRQQVLAAVEVEVRAAKVRNPIKRYELAKALIADAFASAGLVINPMMTANFANQMKAKTAR
jgi:hypothetical protein